MSFLPAPLEATRPDLLTRVSPLTRLLVGALWLLIAFLTVDPVVPAVLLAAGVLALITISGVPIGRVPRRLVPLGIAAVGLGLITVLFHASAGNPAVRAVLTLGPIRITEPAAVAGIALALRLGVIAISSILVFAPSDPTRFADALVQQWRVPPRFAYGTLAALRIAPLLGTDWRATGAVRRLRGLDSRSPVSRVRGFFGRLFVLLVSGVRRGSRMAIAMDARGFDAGLPRSRYREVRAGTRDYAVLGGGVAVALVALLLDRIV